MTINSDMNGFPKSGLPVVEDVTGKVKVGQIAVTDLKSIIVGDSNIVTTNANARNVMAQGRSNNITLSPTTIATTRSVIVFGDSNTVVGETTGSESSFVLGRSNSIISGSVIGRNNTFLGTCTVVGNANTQTAVGVAGVFGGNNQVGGNSPTFGTPSFAIGAENVSVGGFALGNGSIAGDLGFALGNFSGAKKLYSVGIQGSANAPFSLAFGNDAIKDSSCVVGGCLAFGDVSLVPFVAIDSGGCSYRNYNPLAGGHFNSLFSSDYLTNLGAEKVTGGASPSSPNWTVPAGWSGGSHNAAGTGALEQNIGAVVGEYYILTATIVTADSTVTGTGNQPLVIELGGASLTMYPGAGFTGFRAVFKATTTGNLRFVPNTAGRFNVSQVSVKRIQTGNISGGRLIGVSFVAPTIAAGAGAGTTPTVSITGSDMGGVVNVTTGTTPSASAVVATITFAAGIAFANAPYVQLTPANANTPPAMASVYVTSTTTTFVINATTALTASTAYSWNYQITGRE